METGPTTVTPGRWAARAAFMPSTRAISGGTAGPLVPMTISPLASTEGNVVVGDEEVNSCVGWRGRVDRDDRCSTAGYLLHRAKEGVSGKRLEHDAGFLRLCHRLEQRQQLRRVARIRCR